MQPRTEAGTTLTCTGLTDVKAVPDGSAQAEFWLRPGGTANAQRALAGDTRHLPVLRTWLRDHLEGDGTKPGADDPCSAPTIALKLLDAFDELMKPLLRSGWDAVNARPVACDLGGEDEAGFGLLDDAALPRDPHRAAIIGIIDDSIPFAHQRLTVAGTGGSRHSRVASVWMQGARSLTPAADAVRWPADPVPEALGAALGFDRTPPPVGADLILGRELRGGQIDTLLAALGTPLLPDEGTLYRAAGAIDLGRPAPPGWARAGSHGAAVAALAAGFPPVAPGNRPAPCNDAEARRFPVIAVCLPPEVTRDTMGSLGPLFILLAYLHILHRAERLCRFIEARRGLAEGEVRLPVAINLSYGITAGPKDGQTLLERFQDALVRDGWRGLGAVRCILPTGNHRQARLHAQLDAARGNAGKAITHTLRWTVYPDDASANAVEIWGPPEPVGCGTVPRLEVALRPPGAPDFVTAPFAGDGWVALAANGIEIARARRVRHVTPARARDAVTVILHPTMPGPPGAPLAPPGEWQLRVIAPGHGPTDVTLQRDERISGFRSGARQSVLTDEDYRIRKAGGLPIRDDPAPPTSPVRRRGTLNAYATGKRTIRVGGAVADAPWQGAGEQAGARLAGVMLAGAPDAVYSGMDDRGLGGSLVAHARVPGVTASAPADARWKAACDRSPVREGLIAPGILSGSRQTLRGTSLAAPQVTRVVAHALAEEARRRADRAGRPATAGA